MLASRLIRVASATRSGRTREMSSSVFLARAAQLVPDAVAPDTVAPDTVVYSAPGPRTKPAETRQPTIEQQLAEIAHAALRAPTPPWPANARAAVVATARVANSGLDFAPDAAGESRTDRLAFHVAGLETRALLAMTRALAVAVPDAPGALAGELSAAAAIRALADNRETADRPWTPADSASVSSWEEETGGAKIAFRARWLAIDFGGRVLRMQVNCGRTAAGLALVLRRGRGANDLGTAWLIRRAVAADEPLVFSSSSHGREPVGMVVEGHPGYRKPTAAPTPAERRLLLTAAAECIRGDLSARMRQAPALLAAMASTSSGVDERDRAALFAGLALTAPPRSEARDARAAATDARVLAADALLACCEWPLPANSSDPEHYFADPATARTNLPFVAAFVELARGAGPLQVIRDVAGRV